MEHETKSLFRISLLGAIAVASAVSSIIVFFVGFLAAKPFLTDYARGVVRGHHATIESFFTESISQQVLVGDSPEVLRKCHTLLREEYVRAVLIEDLGGEIVCDLRKPDDGYALLWKKSPIYFDEERKNPATEVWLAFSTETEQRLIWVTLFAALAGALLLLVIQILFTIPLSRRILKPLADLSVAVNGNNPEEIRLPDFQSYRPLVVEVRAIFQSMQGFLQRFQLYRTQLIESTRFEAVARTVQIIAHDLKAPMASFERLTRISESQFGQERKHLIQALHQLYSMTDAIKRAEFEDVVRLTEDAVDLKTTLQNCHAIADKQTKSMSVVGPTALERVPCDPSKLCRAISNLIINALEACTTHVAVQIEPGDELLTISVIDDGPGVPAALHERLFSRGATLGKSQGTGLGLHYARRVAQGHGGDIAYERKETFTIFTITIPRGIPFDSNFAVEDSQATTMIEAKSEGQDRGILIVVNEAAKAEALKLQVDSNIEILQSKDVGRLGEASYRFVLCDDWDIARCLKARQQKVLMDPSDGVDRILLVLKRLQSKDS